MTNAQYLLQKIVMPVSNMTLVKIAAVGGVLTVSMGIALRLKINRNICETEYYKDAFKTLRSHPGAVNLLGEPIRDRLLDVGDQEKNYTRQLSAHYEVPVKGPKDKGILYFWAQRKSPDDAWYVNRIELGLKSEPNRRLLIKNIE